MLYGSEMSQCTVRERRVCFQRTTIHMSTYFLKLKRSCIAAIPVILTLQGMPKGASPTVPVVPP